MSHTPDDEDLTIRARRHAALGEPHRLAIVDALRRSDRSPTDLGRALGLSGNLLAHHLDILESSGLIRRRVSSGDRRRRYVQLEATALRSLFDIADANPQGSALFICTHNSARSQLAAALWRARTGHRASSAGTHPAEQVHPGAIAAARRAGLDLPDARPRLYDPDETADVVVTVCDRAHEEIDIGPDWLHWSLPDPVLAETPGAFDATVSSLEHRLASLALHQGTEPTPETLSEGAGS